MFALDSLELRPSLGTLGDEWKATVDFEESAPGLLVGHSTFSPGGADGWENDSLSGSCTGTPVNHLSPS